MRPWKTVSGTRIFREDRYGPVRVVRRRTATKDGGRPTRGRAARLRVPGAFLRWYAVTTRSRVDGGRLARSRRADWSIPHRRRPLEDLMSAQLHDNAPRGEFDRHRLGFRHGDGHLGNFILGNDGTTIRIIDYEQAVRNASCARDGCADQIFLTKADVEHLRNGTSLSMKEAWRSAGAALGAKRGAHSSLRRFFLDGARKARTSHIT